MGGKHFIVFYRLSHNGYTVQTSALADSEANDFVFLDTRLARDLIKFLNISSISLLKPCSVKGYDDKPGKSILEVLILYLEINRYR